MIEDPVKQIIEFIRTTINHNLDGLSLDNTMILQQFFSEKNYEEIKKIAQEELAQTSHSLTELSEVQKKINATYGFNKENKQNVWRSLLNLWERYPSEHKNKKFEELFSSAYKQNLITAGVEYHNRQAIRKITELMSLVHDPEQFSSLLQNKENPTIDDASVLISKCAPLISNHHLIMLFGFLGNYRPLLELRKQILVDYHFEKKDLDVAFWISNYAKVAHTFLNWSTHCGGDAREQAVKDLEGELQTQTVLTHFQQNPYLSELPEEDLLKLMTVLSPVRSPYALIHLLETMQNTKYTSYAYISSFSHLFGVEGGISSFRGIENQCVQIPNSRFTENNASYHTRHTATYEILFLLFDKQMRAAYAELHPESKDSFNYISSLFFARFIRYSLRKGGGHLNAAPEIFNDPLFLALCALKLIPIEEMLDNVLKTLFVHQRILRDSRYDHNMALESLLSKTSENKKDYSLYYKALNDYEQEFYSLSHEQYDGVVKQFLLVTQKLTNAIVKNWATEVLEGKRCPQSLTSPKNGMNLTGEELGCRNILVNETNSFAASSSSGSHSRAVDRLFFQKIENQFGFKIDNHLHTLTQFRDSLYEIAHRPVQPIGSIGYIAPERFVNPYLAQWQLYHDAVDILHKVKNNQSISKEEHTTLMKLEILKNDAFLANYLVENKSNETGAFVVKSRF